MSMQKLYLLVPLAPLFGAMIAGLAGTLNAHLTFFIGANEYGFDRGVEILTMAILGGINGLAGPVLGAFILTLLPETLRAKLAGLVPASAATARRMSRSVMMPITRPPPAATARAAAANAAAGAEQVGEGHRRLGDLERRPEPG